VVYHFQTFAARPLQRDQQCDQAKESGFARP
jgi:hypothetical protein